MSAKEDLVPAAERLFAVHGVDGVSLRQVSTEAGQRNVAAAQYHFGDKRGLIQAIFRSRFERIDARRRERLAAVREAGLERDVRALVEVLVRPLAEQAASPGSHYVRFLNRTCDLEGRAVVPLSFVGPLHSAVEAGEMLYHALEYARRPEFVLRSELAGRLIVVGLADLEQRLAALDWSAERGAPDPEAYADGLVDAVVGMLTAPVSMRP
ncbi:TetR family transcriptional regulator [Actinomadura sp. 9N407]|uniref:TetR family transcriptional regulator n=1 Tax=Actinomadura sp. 9N407 TaxID=3375154 RepID=UPI0037A6A9B7